MFNNRRLNSSLINALSQVDPFQTESLMTAGANPWGRSLLGTCPADHWQHTRWVILLSNPPPECRIRVQLIDRLMENGTRSRNPGMN